MASTSTTSETSLSTSSIATKSTSSSELGLPFWFKWLMGSTEIVSERRSTMKTKYYTDDDAVELKRGWVGGTQVKFEVTQASSYPRHRGTVIIQGILVDA